MVICEGLCLHMYACVFVCVEFGPLPELYAMYFKHAAKECHMTCAPEKVIVFFCYYCGKYISL